MTQRFNRISFWVISVILQKQTTKIRCEVVVQFIRIAKKLHELSNYHGLLAIVSALSHPSVNRLTDTWARVPTKERKCFDTLVKYAPDQDGRELLHSIFQKIKVILLLVNFWFNTFFAAPLYTTSWHCSTRARLHRYATSAFRWAWRRESFIEGNTNCRLSRYSFETLIF